MDERIPGCIRIAQELPYQLTDISSSKQDRIVYSNNRRVWFALGTVLSQLQDEDKDYVVSYTSTQIPANTRDYVKDTYDVTRTTADNEIINTSRFKAGLMRPNKGTI